jgi:hypothetical protein
MKDRLFGIVTKMTMPITRNIFLYSQRIKIVSISRKLYALSLSLYIPIPSSFNLIDNVDASKM